MANEHEAPAPSAAAPAPIPEVPAIVPEPVVPVQADQAPAVVAPAAVAPPAPVAGAEVHPAPEQHKSLLDKFEEKQAAPLEAKPEETPAEVKPEPEAAPVEEVRAAEIAPEPEKAAIEEPIKLDPIEWFAEEGGIKIPEVVSLDDANRDKLTAALELGRADPKAGGQALLDMHAAAMDQFATQLHTKMWEDFSKTRDDWATRVMADPELGGAGHDTAMGRSARMRDAFVSRHEPGTAKHEADMADWKDFLATTGAGDHPAFHRLLNNVARKHDEAAPPPPNPTPPKDLGRKPEAKGKLEYTHPTSQPGN